MSRRATPSRSGTACAADNIDVPRARVSLDNVTATNYQKTGVLLDGNLAYTATKLTIGAAGTLTANRIAPHVIAANSVKISRGAAGSLTDSTIANNLLRRPDDDQTPVSCSTTLGTCSWPATR